MGRGLCCVLGTLKVFSSRVESCGTQTEESHKPSRLAPRSVQTALPCASSQPSRESKLHEDLKGFFYFFISKELSVLIVLLFKMKNMIDLANSCNLPCNSGDTQDIPAPTVRCFLSLT